MSTLHAETEQLPMFHPSTSNQKSVQTYAVTMLFHSLKKDILHTYSVSYIIPTFMHYII